jgi:hypothetical protein
MENQHNGLASWSCVNLIDWKAAYYQPSAAGGNREEDRCGYCGVGFRRSGPGVPTEEDCLTRENHLYQEQRTRSAI